MSVSASQLRKHKQPHPTTKCAISLNSRNKAERVSTTNEEGSSSPLRATERGTHTEGARIQKQVASVTVKEGSRLNLEKKETTGAQCKGEGSLFFHETDDLSKGFFVRSESGVGAHWA